jgi:hypothetical protein
VKKTKGELKKRLHKSNRVAVEIMHKSLKFYKILTKPYPFKISTVGFVIRVIGKLYNFLLRMRQDRGLELFETLLLETQFNPWTYSFRNTEEEEVPLKRRK